MAHSLPGVNRSQQCGSPTFRYSARPLYSSSSSANTPFTTLARSPDAPSTRTYTAATARGVGGWRRRRVRKHTTRTTQLVGGHRQRRTCPNTCMYTEGRPDTECEDEYLHIRISHGPRQGACKRSCDTYLHRDIDSEDRNTRIRTTNFSTEVQIFTIQAISQRRCRPRHAAWVFYNKY